MYEFKSKLRQGEAEEAELDREFSRRWQFKCRPVSMALQRLGIDRIWEAPDGRRFSVEYKADWTAARTGNVFIETVSVDSEGVPGWALTSLAQLLVYYIPPLKLAYVVYMTAIKKQLHKWFGRYEQKAVPNGRDGETVYRTLGLAVPLAEFERDCKPQTVVVGAGDN